MTKAKSKPKAATRSTARKTSKPKSRTRSAPSPSKTATRHQARPHHCNASDACGRNGRCHQDCNRMAAACGARLSCRRRPQETWSQSCFRVDGQGPGLSHQGWKGFVRRCGSREAGGLMRCGRSAATVAQRPRSLLRTRSRICAVSISRDFAHVG
jgi:hypothetical protein